MFLAAAVLLAMMAGCLAESATEPVAVSSGELGVQSGYTPGFYGEWDKGYYKAFILEWGPVTNADHYVVKLSPVPITADNWNRLPEAKTLSGDKDTCWVFPQPEIYENTCIGCGQCEDICPQDAITLDGNGRAVIDLDLCTSCGECVRTCPVSAILDSRFDQAYYFGIRAYDEVGDPIGDVLTTEHAYRMIYQNDPERCDRCWDYGADTTTCYMLTREPLCPVDAIYWDSLKVYHIDYDKCINCGNCHLTCRTYGVHSMSVNIVEE